MEENTSSSEKKKKSSPPSLAPWQIGLILSCSIIGLVLLGLFIYVAYEYTRKNKTQKLNRNQETFIEPRKDISYEEAWIQLGLGQALGLTPKQQK